MIVPLRPTLVINGKLCPFRLVYAPVPNRKFMGNLIR
jgi:hypothetical protein